jgi:aspartate racemase
MENPGSATTVSLSSTTLGVIGGMGPEATALFYSRLIRACQQRFGAAKDSDYPRVILDSLPVDDFVDDRPNPEVLQRLLSSARTLQSLGADYVVMPCCSIHYFAREIEEVLQARFISIISITVEALVSAGFQQVSVLSTSVTDKTDLFSLPLSSRHIRVIDHGEQQTVQNVIRAVLAGTAGEKEAGELENVARIAANRGAEAIVLGCTDIPIIFPAANCPVPVIDPLQILVDRSVECLKRAADMSRIRKNSGT